MVVVTVAPESAEDEARLLELLPTVHGRVIEKNDVPVLTPDDIATREQRLKKAIDALQRIADRGGLTSFGDPSEWQRDVRSWDRVLDGREE